MKKLVLSLLVSAVAVNAFGMEMTVTPAVELAKQDVAMIKAFTYPIFGTIGLGMGLGIAGYYGHLMWSDYLHYAKKTHQASNASNTVQNSTWAPYAKIAAGLALTGLSGYLGMKQSQQPQTMITKYSSSGSNGDDMGSTLSPHIMISFGSLYTLAPMVPAYYFLKSGFEDLKK